MTLAEDALAAQVYPGADDLDAIYPGLSQWSTSDRWAFFSAADVEGVLPRPPAAFDGRPGGTAGVWYPQHVVDSVDVKARPPFQWAPTSPRPFGTALLLNQIDSNGWCVLGISSPGGDDTLTADARATTRHFHDTDQIIVVFDGELRYGNQVLRRGGVTFNPAGSAYVRTSGSEGALYVEVRHSPWYAYGTWYVEPDVDVWLRAGYPRLTGPPRAWAGAGAPTPRGRGARSAADLLAQTYPGVTDFDAIYPGLSDASTSDRWWFGHAADAVGAIPRPPMSFAGRPGGTAAVHYPAAIVESIDLSSAPRGAAPQPHEFGVKVLLNQLDANGWSVLGIREPPHGELSTAAQRVQRHYHDVDQIILVIEGELRYGNRVLGPGDGTFNPAGSAYIRTSGPEGALYLEIRHSPWHAYGTWYTEDDPDVWLEAGYRRRT